MVLWPGAAAVDFFIAVRNFLTARVSLSGPWLWAVSLSTRTAVLSVLVDSFPGHLPFLASLFWQRHLTVFAFCLWKIYTKCLCTSWLFPRAPGIKVNASSSTTGFWSSAILILKNNSTVLAFLGWVTYQILIKQREKDWWFSFNLFGNSVPQWKKCK